MRDIASPLDGFSSPFGVARGGYSPASLFANGEQGVWLQPSPSTCFTDLAGTTAAGIGDPVALIRDGSGNGNHATQSVEAERPVLRQAGGLYYLECDGVDNLALTAAIDFTSTSAITAFVGLRKQSDDAFGVAVELSSDSNANAGAFGIFAPFGASANYTLRARGDTTARTINATPYAAPTTNVLTCAVDLTAPLSSISVDGGTAVTQTDTFGGGTFGNYALFVGSRDGNNPLNGRLYSVVVRGAASTSDEVAAAEAFVAERAGVTL